MKNQYIIVKHLDNSTTLYFSNAVSPVFTSNRKLAEVFTNKKTANDKMKYASKYASGSEFSGSVEIIKL